jgi:hypothetical protein
MLLLLACADPPPPPAPDLGRFGGPERACLERHCASAASDDALAACRTATCAHAPEAWRVNPTLLRYDGDVVTMSVQVEYTPAAYGDVPEPRSGDTWLGATVLTDKGEEIDLAVQTVFTDKLSQPFTFSSQVGPGVDVAIIGLWGKKIEPCDSSRSGCQMFGFVLDQSLAAWPPDTYVESPPRRQRFLPEELSVAVVTPDGRSPAAVLDLVRDFTSQEGERFGAKLRVEPAPFASRLALLLAVEGSEAAVRHAPDARADLVVHDGTCAGEACR